MFHLVSLSLQISLTDLPGPCLGLCVGVACFVVLGGFVVGFFLLGKFDLNHMLIPVVDRPCLALVRQCRKKKRKKALDLLFHWTIKATRNEFLYWVHGALSLICTFLD